MKYVKLNRTEMEVSVVSMGCWAIASPGMWGEQDESAAIEAIRTSVDCGVNFFDSAEGYGRGYSEQLLGKALEGKRDKVVIATKTLHYTADGLRRACEGSLQKLGTDYIDLYYLHWPSREVPREETIRAVEDLKREGKILEIGVSNFGKLDLTELLALHVPVVNQLPYSLLWRAIEYDIQNICVENDIGITCYSPLMQGLLTGKFKTPDDVPPERARTRFFSGDRSEARHGEEGAEEVAFEAIDKIRTISDGLGIPMNHLAIAWLTAQPAVTSVIAGARNPEQARANAAAADVELPADVLQQLAAATDELKKLMGDNPDMWQSESRYR